MSKAVYDQINNLIEKSRKILLLTHAKADCDGVGSAITVYMLLKELGKDVAVATNDPVAESMRFLPSIEILQNSLAGNSEFVISIDISKTPISKIKYNAEEHRMNIIITPKEGSFSPADVSFNQGGKSEYDLIMIFDTGNLEHLGPLYDNNVELFYNTPIINVDHHASNTDYGQVNLVDVTSASTTEVLYEFLVDLEDRMNQKLITADMATLLLAGLITDTGSFQHANTSPKSMETAAKLLDLGARQQEIIKNIYKTKKLSTLKLWGIILSKVQVDPVYRMVWSSINKEDLTDSGASSDESEGIIDDLLTNAPGAEVIFLIKYNEEGYVSISFRSTSNQIDVGSFCAENGGGGHIRAAGFKVKDGRPFEQIAAEVVEKVRQWQADRLNIQAEELPMNPPVVSPNQKPLPLDEKKGEPAGELTQNKEIYLDFKAPKSDSGPNGEPNSEPIVDDTAPQPKPADEHAGVPVETEEESSAPKKRNRRRRRRPRNPGGGNES